MEVNTKADEEEDRLIDEFEKEGFQKEEEKKQKEEAKKQKEGQEREPLPKAERIPTGQSYQVNGRVK